jgi:adenylate kinase family enzyme
MTTSSAMAGLGLAQTEKQAPEQRPGSLFDEAMLTSLWRSRRILVLGSSGAGKSHLTRALAEILGIGAIHLDAHFWRPDGKPCGDREWRKIAKQLAARESWIMDGTYERSLDLRIPRADAIILLECPAELCLERVLRRETEIPKLRGRKRRSGSAYQIDQDHVQYVTQYAAVTHPIVLELIERYGRGKAVAVLQAPEAVGSFLSGVAARCGQRAAGPIRRAASAPTRASESALPTRFERLER